MESSREFEPGNVALLKTHAHGDAKNRIEYTIISGPTGPSKFYQARGADGKTDLIPERELVHKPQQADRLTPVKWKDCAWIPEILR
ncbi:MAG TPA: hypothetical protein VF534_01670 [Paraburkholderia sp.]